MARRGGYRCCFDKSLLKVTQGVSSLYHSVSSSFVLFPVLGNRKAIVTPTSIERFKKRDCFDHHWRVLIKRV